MKACLHCGQEHSRRKFCSNACKDQYHNLHNPRGYRRILTDRDEDYQYSNAGQDAMEDGWDGHKNAF